MKWDSLMINHRAFIHLIFVATALIFSALPFTTSAQVSAEMSTTVNTICDGTACNYDGPSILINELMLSPSSFDGSMWGGQNSQRGEWIELYNPDICNPIDISCYYLGNNADDSSPYPGGYVIPPGTIIPPAGFAMIRGVNAASVPNHLLVENGGNVVELVVTGEGVCVGDGSRLWFPNAGGWFGFYDSDGVPQDAVSWASMANINLEPCVPEIDGCSLSGGLVSYNGFPADRKNYILNVSAAIYQGQSLRRIPDGGSWDGPGTPTYATCNAACVNVEFTVCNGTATVNPQDGLAPFTYLWDDPQHQTTQTATRLCAGEYCVEITDALGQTTIECVIVEEASYDIHMADGLCPGESYTLPDNSTTATPGEYVFEYITSGGCDSVVTLTLDFFPDYHFELDAEICSNHSYTMPDGSEQSISGNYVFEFVTESGCDSVYTVNLNVLPPVQVPLAASICPGSTYILPDGTEVSEANLYEVLMPGGQVCDTLFLVDLMVYPEIEVEVSATDISCTGAGDGSAELLISGGTTPYTFIWSNGWDQGASATDLEAGNYSVQIIDVNNCSTTISFDINEPSPVQIIASTEELICIGSNSTLTATASGGTGNFTYHWSHTSETSETAIISPTADTEYTVYAMDDNGCITETITLNVTVIDMNESLLTLTSGPAVCSGESTTVEAFYDGAHPPYSYTWSHGLPNGPGPHSVNPVETTVYTVTVQDDCGNQVQAQIEVVINPLPEIEVNINHISCYGNNDGTAELNVSSGTPPYSYNWSNGHTGHVAENLTPGTYTVVVSDAEYCSSEVIFTIEEPALLELSANANDLICPGEEVTLSAVATGGTGNYTYHWNQNLADAAAHTVSPASSTTYTVYATDENECVTETIELTVEVILMSEDLLTLTAGPAVCSGESTTVEAFYDGAHPPYSYTWSHGLPNGPGPHSVNPVETTVYTVTVQDDCGNQVQAQIEVVINPLPEIEVNINHISCYGNNDGTAELNVSSGTPPYSYNWSNGHTGHAAENLTPGTYTVVVTDAEYCSSEVIFTIEEPALLELSANANDLICPGEEVTLSAVATGGTGNYTYHWNQNLANAAAHTVSPASSTTYTVYATDENGCVTETIELTVEVAFMTEELLFVIPGDPYCAGESTTISALYFGVHQPYNYSWSHDLPSTTGPHEVSPTETTTYTVTISDFCGNEITRNITVVVNPLPELTIDNQSDVQCFGENNGAVAVSVASGTPAFQYEWSSSSSTGNVAGNLTPGVHQVKVTDVHGCSDSLQFTIEEPSPVSISASAVSLVCPEAPFALSAQATGGVGDFSYIWSHTNNTNPEQSVSLTESTNFTVYAVDANGCATDTQTLAVTVMTMTADQLSTISGDAVCLGASTTVAANYSGVWPPYSYEWSHNLPSTSGPHVVSPDESQDYTVTVSDQCGNSVQAEVPVVILPIPVADLPAVMAEGCEDLRVTFSDTINDPANHSWVWTVNEQQHFSGHTFNHLFTEPGVHTVDLSVTSFGGCNAKSAYSSLVIVKPSPSAAFTANPWETEINHPEITFTNQSQGSNLTYWWNFGDATTSGLLHPVHAYSDIGTYQVTLVVENGYQCVDSVSHRVLIKPSYNINIPNAFTPTGNNNGYYDPNNPNNDIFYPFADYVDEFRMTIFNRWGEIIFESEDINYGWNGWYRDAPSPMDVYVYKIEFVFSDGAEITKVGDLTLFR